MYLFRQKCIKPIIKEVRSRFIKLIYFCLLIFLSLNSYALNSPPNKSNYAGLSCNELINKLMRESSYKFLDKNLILYYERYNNRYVGITNVCRQKCIYANFQLDLYKGTLRYIDPSPEILIKINKEYIPFIAKECTPDKNLYRRGKLPDPEYDGSS